MEMSYFSLPNYSMVFENRRLSTLGGLIPYVHDDFEYRSLSMSLYWHVNQNCLKAFLLKYGESRVYIKNT